ncbi:hypothetical protein DPEC_G00281210 [Dallia pectoralis]|uniref:Uncharacterized protein n=1 Tax=Dallia pectoralis TaxID=75939 RepID=A0ACC2FMX5_DALPE|nr:hypothetical protein DPEC_G00281210 [Dallia pectoralis]
MRGREEWSLQKVGLLLRLWHQLPPQDSQGSAGSCLDELLWITRFTLTRYRHRIGSSTVANSCVKSWAWFSAQHLHQALENLFHGS